MVINFVNNDGAGFAGELSIPEGTTIDKLFYDKMGSDADPLSYHIKVNRDVVAPGYVLKNGDRVSIVPAKVEAATV